jgi:peptidoglycan hydrolase CwlO-like protein
MAETLYEKKLKKDYIQEKKDLTAKVLDLMYKIEDLTNVCADQSLEIDEIKQKLGIKRGDDGD